MRNDSDLFGGSDIQLVARIKGVYARLGGLSKGRLRPSWRAMERAFTPVLVGMERRGMRECCPGFRSAPSGLRSYVSARYTSTIILKPPTIMRLPSNGIPFGSIIAASLGSFIALALTRSRCARDLY